MTGSRLDLDAIVRAVRTLVSAHDLGDEVCVGVSGGPDSLALAGAAVRAGLRVTALVVDHGLQAGSDGVAARAAGQARTLGASADILGVHVEGRGGPEGAARSARYAALDAARAGRPVLLGHTLDDQAETVLLGLGRGSGPRSIAGMAPWSAPWGRPMLGVRRAATVGACVELGVTPWYDPHNTDPRYVRARLRSEVLPLLDDVLGGGVATALARTADQVREDSELLDVLADQAATRAIDGKRVDLAILRDLATPVRRRVLRRWLRGIGAGDLSARLITAVDDCALRGGETAVGGDVDHRLWAVADDDALVVRRRVRSPHRAV